MNIDGLHYTLDRPPTKNGRRNVATVRLADHPDSPGFTDRVDLYAFKSRYAFAKRISDSFGRRTDEIMGHLALILDTVERETTQDPGPEELTEERRAQAHGLLEATNLLDAVACTMESLGYVGEAETKRLAYLVATSRLLPKPLSAILMAPSGCGKSELLEITAQLLPPEQVEFLSRLTPQALFYSGADHLRHKLVIVDEQAGASEADYAIRTLQSKGLLRLAVPIKGKTEPFTVHGPISLMSGTTSSSLDPENLSRCLELPLDDSPEQTKRIQAAQCRAWAGERTEPVDPLPWQDAQRCLESKAVVIPFAHALKFPTRTTADRRGSAKLLGLVAAHALLYQRQRRTDRAGRIIATSKDYAAVYKLLRPLAHLDLEGLSPRAARCYRLLAEREEPLTRRDIAHALGWNYMTAARALEDLRSQELVQVVEGGVPRRYRVVPQGLGLATVLTPPSHVYCEA